MKTPSLKSGLSAPNPCKESAVILELLDGIALSKSNWGIYLLLEIMSGGEREAEVPSDILMRGAYERRYERRLPDEEVVGRKASLKAALRSGWTTLSGELVPEINRLLNEDPATAGMRLSVSRSIGNGSGNKSIYAYKITGLFSEQESKLIKNEDGKSVRFSLVSLPAMPWYSGWLEKLEPRSALSAAYWSVVLLFAALMSGLAFNLLLNASSLGVAVFVVIPLGIFYYTFLMPFLAAHQFKTALAPKWLGVRIRNLLIEWRPNKAGSVQIGTHSMRLAAYRGTCPKCSGELSLKPGGIRFWGRIVARCESNPREHIYSFDHITKNGYEIQ